MKLRRLIASIAVAGLVMGTTVNVHAGTDDKKPVQKQGQRAAQLKKGDTEQGTFAYRFDTYTNYTQGGGECSLSSTTCASSMNSDLSNTGAYGGQVVKPLDKKDQKPAQIKQTDTTPAND